MKIFHFLITGFIVLFITGCFKEEYDEKNGHYLRQDDLGYIWFEGKIDYSYTPTRIYINYEYNDSCIFTYYVEAEGGNSSQYFLKNSTLCDSTLDVYYDLYVIRESYNRRIIRCSFSFKDEWYYISDIEECKLSYLVYVNNIEYKDVYKFNFNYLEKEMPKEILFAKGYGIIRILFNDGRKIERIEL